MFRPFSGISVAHSHGTTCPVLIDRQIDNRQTSLKKQCPVPTDPYDGLYILPAPDDGESKEGHSHFSLPIVPGPLENDRLPINIFILGTSSRGISIRASTSFFMGFTFSPCHPGILPNESLRSIIQRLRRRRLLADLSRMEYFLTDGVRLLDCDASVEESGLCNNSTLYIRIRVRGGSSRLNPERMCTLLLGS